MQSSRSRSAPRLKLADSAASLTGVGPQLAGRLERLGVHTLADLLCLLPLRYEDRSTTHSLGSLRPGTKCLVEGEIALSEVTFGRRRALLVRLADGTGSLTLRFFHFSRQQQSALARGERLRCFGEVRAGPTGLEMVHPEYRSVADEDAGPDAAFTPVYPTTEGLHQARLRRLVDQVIGLAPEIDDLLGDVLDPDWPGLDEAIAFLHKPPTGTDLAELATRKHPAQRRIALEELIAQRLSLKQLRAVQAREESPVLAAGDDLIKGFTEALGFELTGAQARAVGEVAADMANSTPMHRLLQGDVGSGKTVVAAIAMHIAVASGAQAALMVPTELLAEQHASTLASWFESLGQQVVLLTGSLGAAERRRRQAQIATGEVKIIVGTHALFQESVEFKRLALIVVDEQHRFGVNQRLTLKRKSDKSGQVAHQLTMTATPIPRTLAMTAYADLDCSVIDELPAGRTPVQTVALPQNRRPELVERVVGHCQGGAQAYWVCPFIEESENIDASAAETLAAELRAALPELAIGLVHGRLSAKERDEAMRRFKAGETSLLIATTVIEVGVDVPNASLMIIENAERMGLAQLHQLRGRVGRGSEKSNCVLLFGSGLSRVGRERLAVMRETTDGFVISEKDLELRGPGEVLGTRQTGLQELRVADLQFDADLLPLVVSVSDRVASDYPERVAPLISRWIKSGAEYARV